MFYLFFYFFIFFERKTVVEKDVKIEEYSDSVNAIPNINTGNYRIFLEYYKCILSLLT